MSNSIPYLHWYCRFIGLLVHDLLNIFINIEYVYFLSSIVCSMHKVGGVLCHFNYSLFPPETLFADNAN